MPDTIKKKSHTSIHTSQNVNYTHSPNRTNVDTTPARSWLYAECQYFMKKTIQWRFTVPKAALAYVKYTERQKYVVHTKPMLNQRLLRWLNFGPM